VTTAARKYVQFHQHEPKKTGTFHPSLVIPETIICVGDAQNILYSSDKLNPTTGEDEGWIDYIHKHDGGVKIYMPRSDGTEHKVPASIRGVTELTWLGKCLGFSYRDIHGKACEAKGTEPLPELYTVPSGRALLVIQSRRTLLAMIWGGRLGVQPRGIVH